MLGGLITSFPMKIKRGCEMGTADSKRQRQKVSRAVLCLQRHHGQHMLRLDRGVRGVWGSHLVTASGCWVYDSFQDFFILRQGRAKLKRYFICKDSKK